MVLFGKRRSFGSKELAIINYVSMNKESKFGDLPNTIIEWFCKFCFLADRF